jgi:hypothetical protein
VWEPENAINLVAKASHHLLRTQVSLLRDLLANPFQPLPVLCPSLTGPESLVVSLAQAAYDQRILPEGALDPLRLAILADALEELGCTDAEVLGHLRSPGPHARGCWAVDLLLKKA